jgi:hypothetical protein
LPHPLIAGVIEIAPIISGAAFNGRVKRWVSISRRLSGSRQEATRRQAGFVSPLSERRTLAFTDLDLRAGFVGVSAIRRPGSLYYAALGGGLRHRCQSRSDGSKRGSSTVSGWRRAEPGVPAIIADVLNVPISVPPTRYR